MIDRRANNRQAERHVDRAPERDELHRNQSLIVITRDDHVEFAFERAHEQRVGGNRPGDVDASGAAAGDGGSDRRLFFAAEQSVFAGVRIQSGDGDPRLHLVEQRELACRQRDRLFHETLRQKRRHVCERNMNGREHHAQLV